MSLYYGRPPQPLTVLPTRRYHPDELEARATDVLRGGGLVNGGSVLGVPPPALWLRTDGMMLLLAPQDISLACRVAAAYHDALVSPETPYNDDDGFMAETRAMEARAMAHMQAMDDSGSGGEDAAAVAGPPAGVCWGGCKG